MAGQQGLVLIPGRDGEQRRPPIVLSSSHLSHPGLVVVGKEVIDLILEFQEGGIFLPEALKSHPILDLESYAVIVSLHSLQRFVSGVKVTLLTDSRVLFYLFSSTGHNSSVKIKRWCLKIIYDFPYVVLGSLGPQKTSRTSSQGKECPQVIWVV